MYEHISLSSLMLDPSHQDAQHTIKIMLATDNHIGYLERDPIRGQDAISTFEEILKLAVKLDVCLLDTFHCSMCHPVLR